MFLETRDIYNDKSVNTSGRNKNCKEIQFIYAANSRVLKYMKQKLTELVREIDSPTIK